MSTNGRESEIRGYVDDLNNRILQGDILGAFEHYYHDDCVMLDNQNEPTNGKDANRKREQDWLAGVTEFRGAEVKSVGIDAENNTALVEWIFDYSHKDFGDVYNHQVSIQRWDGDKIIHERFVYG